MIYAILGPRRASGVAYNIDKLTNHPCNNAAGASIRMSASGGFSIRLLSKWEYRRASREWTVAGQVNKINDVPICPGLALFK